MTNIIWGVIVVLVVLWMIGTVVKFGGELIHWLLVLVAIGVVYQLFAGRRAE